jgi:hypothetical protein
VSELFTASATPEDEDPNKDYLAELVGDDKKFKTSQDLAKGKAEADRFILQLQEELAGIRQDLNTRVTLEAFMDKMNTTKPLETPSTDQNNQNDPGTGEKGITTADIERLLEERISAREAQRTQETNVSEVKSKLTEAFGPDYVNKLKAKTSELGLSEDFMSKLAKEQPKAFLQLIGVSATQSRQAPTNSLFTPPSSNSQGSFAPTADKSHSTYEALRKSDPAKYWTPEVQNQLHKDAQRLGERFFVT